MIKFLKYVLAYFCDKEPEEPKVVEVPINTEQSSSLNLCQMQTPSPTSVIIIKNKHRYGGGGMMVMGSMADGCFDPQALINLDSSTNADALGKGLAELFKKYGVNLSVKGNLGDREGNVTTSTLVNYLDQI